MSTHHPLPLAIAATTVDAHTLRLRLDGDLDHTGADDLLTAVHDHLAAHPNLRDLHVDCTGLRTCDAIGLSTLLTIHRRTTAAEIHLHLDHRPPTLDRLLTVTGTLPHLAGPATAHPQSRHHDPRHPTP